MLSSLRASSVRASSSDPVPEPSSAAAATVAESRASCDASEILIQFDPVGSEATPQPPAAAHAQPAQAASALPGDALEPDAVARAGWRTPTRSRTLTLT